ncbi:hypothetical protein [Fluviicola taffensis]|uniref:Uncharacterized protein n=1 Tax=Fluviicola taffensis (strain DSM 16823 / NCIMB 13979 / RW262) TaxID=755732 RepID=F2IC98_FLUTR|nr:hypothetical protein [Fluviicola taffensis]AEA44344.1 hypothetical protein Fluta_2358 [Fluviicola taffensis DSM 16823]
MKTLKLILGCLFFVNTLNAQTVEWLTPKNKSDFSTVIWDEGGDFYIISSQLIRFENKVKVAEQKITFNIPGNAAWIFDGFSFNGKLVIIIKQKEKTIERFFYQVYDKSCNPVGDPVLIGEYKNKYTDQVGSIFSFKLSSDKMFALFEYFQLVENGGNNQVSYKVIDSNFAVKLEGEYKPSSQMINNTLVADDGTYIMGLAEYERNERGEPTKVLVSYQLKLFQGGEESELDIDFNGRRYSSFKSFIPASNQLVLFGAFKNEGDIMNSYSFSIIDIVKKKEIKHMQFKPDLITKNETIREINMDANGDLIVLMEEYYGKSSDNGVSYHYKKAFVFKMKEDGGAEWIVEIPKHQWSLNDSGIGGSLRGYFLNDTYYLFFNDHQKNYGETGDFLKPKEIEIFTDRIAKRGFAKVEIDLKSGESKRNLMQISDDSSLWSIPIYFTRNYERSEMFIYFMNNKNVRYGLMKF